MNIRKGDKVKVLYGKDSGKTGNVVRILRKKMQVVVEGVNRYKKHVKGDGQTKKSEIVTVTRPLHMSKVMVVDPTSGKATRIGRKRSGKKYERVAMKTGKVMTAVKKEAKKVEKKTTKKVAKKTTKKKVTKKESKK